MSDADVLFSESDGIGRIQLNRPAALNTLTLDMCRAMDARLRAWANDEHVEAIIVRQTGDKAFCAGGDVRKLAVRGSDYPLRFWAVEYRLNALIKHYPKPYISLIDGIAMGGGVGISAHGSHRIVTERVRFAMPEVAIGFFPDTGGSYLLSRMPGQLGAYLGLTGTSVGAADAVYCGYGTHSVPRDQLDELEAAIVADPGGLDETIARFSSNPGPAPLASRQMAIDTIFAGDHLEAIVAALERDGSAFAGETAAMIATKAPFLLKLTLSELRRGRRLEFDDCMRMEWRLAVRTLERGDFHEGVRALLVDKDGAPRWHPATPSEVDDGEVAAFFMPLPVGEIDLQ